MLGLPLGGWLRFFAVGFVAGALLLLVPVKPMAFLSAFVMAAAAAGLLVVGSYARSYAPWPWRRLAVRARRGVRALTRLSHEACDHVRAGAIRSRTNLRRLRGLPPLPKSAVAP